MLSLREQFEGPGAFVVAAELITSRGLIGAGSGRELLETARELAMDPRIGVRSITFLGRDHQTCGERRPERT